MKEFETHDALDLAHVAVLFGPPCMVLLSAAWFSLLATGAISGRTFFWLLGANIPITAAAVGVVFLVVRTSAVGVAHMATAAGNIAPPPSYPNHDLLIAQGKYGYAGRTCWSAIWETWPVPCNGLWRWAGSAGSPGCRLLPRTG